MKLLKKSVVFALIFALLSFGCSCGNDHAHSYKENEVKPTASMQGYVDYECSCGDTYRKYYGYSGEKQENMNGYSILFIGNSYTFWCDLPNLFKRAAESAGIDVAVDSVTHGGYSLISFADENDHKVDDLGEGNGSMVAKKLNDNKYDIVFLQDYSTQTLNSKKDFYAGVYLLNEKVKANGAKSVLYATWTRKEGSSDLGKYTVESMTKTIAANYNVMGEVLNAPVSPVGIAFYKCITKYNNIELYDSDMSHPSIYGHYLASLCHFATIYGLSPEAVTFQPNGVDDATAAILKQIAYEAVFEKFEIEEEYTVSKDYVNNFLQDKVTK